MKKSSVLIIASAIILSSCGAITQMASSDGSQRFHDGIYNNTPSFRTKAEKIESQAESQALAQKTKESQIYLFGDKKDTVAIPQDMAALIRYDQKLGGTIVTVGENPYDWRFDLENNYGYWYGPYSLGSSWYWSRHYSPWYSLDFAPWRYRGWYDSWYFGSWYNPYYYGGFYGGWYDPWYWGSHWGWYDPWYSPYYCGWYGGWDPYWGHHHHHVHGPGHIGGVEHNKDAWYGSRHQTGSDRVFGSGSSLRGGIGSRSTVSRNSGTDGRTAGSRMQASSGESSGRATARRTVTSKPAANRSSVVRTTPSIRNEKTSLRNIGTAYKGTVANGITTTERKPSAAGKATIAVQSNHRRPAATSVIGGTVTRDNSTNSSYNRTPSAVDRSSSYERNTSRNTSNTSTYNRSNTSTSRSSFSSGGGSTYSRSSSGGGFSSGGSSRSGGSAGTRR